MIRNFPITYVLIIGVALLTGSDAIGQTAMLTGVSRPKGNVQPPGNQTVTFTASGSYNVGGFGPVGKVTLQVRYKDPGARLAVWQYSAEAAHDLTGQAATGNFNCLLNGVPSNPNFIYEAKVRLYNANGDVICGTPTASGATENVEWKIVTP